MILSFLSRQKLPTPIQSSPKPQKSAQKKTEDKPLILLEDLKMGRDIAFPEEYTEEVADNLKLLAKTIDKYLKDLGLKKRVIVTSGWRPSSLNKRAGGAKKSLHMLGLAADLLDDEAQSLAKLCLTRPELLKKHKLWMEDPIHTKGSKTNWVHLDLGKRSDRPLRIFKP